MSEDKLLDARTNAAHAKSLLDDEMLKGAFADLRQTYIDKLLTTTIDQSDAREKLYVAVRVVSEVEHHLQVMVDNGKVADAELNHLIQMAEAKKTWSQV